MLCPMCGCDKSIIYWTDKGEETTTRRRECTKCLTRWETVETFRRTLPLKTKLKKKEV